MKIIGIENEQIVKKQINARKILITVLIFLVALIFGIISLLYIFNKNFRNFMDKYILMKNVMENAVTAIQIEESQANLIYAYDKYISILSQNKLIGYNSDGGKEYELDIEIADPIVDTNNRFLLIAEKEKQKIYLISGNSIEWQNELEGNISRVSVNKNGYVSVVLSGTSYKSIIQIFDPSGNSMFKTYLSSSIVVDTDISNDNKYLSFAEISTNGTVVKSMIKTLPVQNAQESKITNISTVNDAIITNLKYQDGNKLMCMYNNSIHLLQGESDEELYNLEQQKITFADIELTNHAYIVNEKSSLLTTQTTVEIINTSSKKISKYEIDSGVKEIYSHNENIALNLGSEVHFIGTNGWLNRKYISTQEVRKIVLADNFAGIVYRDKIEIVKL